MEEGRRPELRIMGWETLNTKSLKPRFYDRAQGSPDPLGFRVEQEETTQVLKVHGHKPPRILQRSL